MAENVGGAPPKIKSLVRHCAVWCADAGRARFAQVESRPEAGR